jgi:hypothetical protein
MAIITPIAISLMVGVVDFGMALSTQATGEKSVRDAARYLASLPANVVCSTQALTNAQNLAVYGNQTGLGLPLIAGWSAYGGPNNYVDVTFLDPNAQFQATGCNTSPSVIQVQAKFQYQSIMLSAILPNLGTLTLSAQHEEPSSAR